MKVRAVGERPADRRRQQYDADAPGVAHEMGITAIAVGHSAGAIVHAMAHPTKHRATAAPRKRPHARRPSLLQIFSGEVAQNHVQSWSFWLAPKTQQNAAVLNRLPRRSARRSRMIMANSSLVFVRDAVVRAASR